MLTQDLCLHLICDNSNLGQFWPRFVKQRIVINHPQAAGVQWGGTAIPHFHVFICSVMEVNASLNTGLKVSLRGCRKWLAFLGASPHLSILYPWSASSSFLGMYTRRKVFGSTVTFQHGYYLSYVNSTSVQSSSSLIITLSWILPKSCMLTTIY